MRAYGGIAVALLAIAASPVGCFESRAPTCTVDCTSDDECPSGLTCGPSNKCSEDGAVCVDPACTKGTSRCELGDSPTRVESCGTEGTWSATETCAAGCLPGPARCAHIVPTYAALKDICDAPAAEAERVFTTPATFGTEDASTCTTVIPQSDGPAICVVRARTIAVKTNIAYAGIRVVALVADGDLVIDGSVSVSARGPSDGPGGGGQDQVSGGGALGNIGGGGAGFRSAGGNGGQSTGPGNGGAVAPDPTGALKLVGGYRAGMDAGLAVPGGGAGGGLALISCAGTIHVNGDLAANGGGGDFGGDYDTDFRSGAGGGSGGLIALQAMHVELGLAGALYANGGGGGGGGALTGVHGVAGDDGPLDAFSCANGGTPGGSPAAGGDGGCKAHAPRAGVFHMTSSGGGGGAMGWVIVYLPPGSSPTSNSAKESSPELTQATIEVR